MIPSLTKCNSYIIIYQSQFSKFKKEEIFIIPSLIQCNSYIMIYQFQLTKFKKEEIFMIPSLTQCNSYIMIYQSQLSKFKKRISKLINCNSYVFNVDIWQTKLLNLSSSDRNIITMLLQS